jgi:hypothetical protein
MATSAAGAPSEAAFSRLGPKDVFDFFVWRRDPILRDENLHREFAIRA